MKGGQGTGATSDAKDEKKEKRGSKILKRLSAAFSRGSSDEQASATVSAEPTQVVSYTFVGGWKHKGADEFTSEAAASASAAASPLDPQNQVQEQTSSSKKFR